MDTHILDVQSSSSKLQVSTTAESLITVIGVGGAGGNAVNNMIEANLEGCGFAVANTDAQALAQSVCIHKIQLGPQTTDGLGADANPEVGAAAAEETLEEIKAAIEGSSMLFITAGMGGGTGTGAAPVVARLGREAGLLTVGVVSKPFAFEGTHRMKLAEAGIAELSKHVDTLIVIPNQNLFQIADDQTTFADAFKLADDVLLSGVRGVTDLVVLPGLINLDFADIRAIMTGMGKAVMGTGKAKGENRAVRAAEEAISNPLLDDVSVKGAQSVLINITGGPDLSLIEVDQAANRIRSEVDPEANIIFGSAFDENLDGAMRVSVIATGREIKPTDKPANKPLASVSGNVVTQKANGRVKRTATIVRAGVDTSPAANDSAVETNGSEVPSSGSSDEDSANAPIAERPVPDMRFIVCDLAVGVRIYKVPHSKTAQVRSESHANRMQIFDSLEKPKGAADNLCQRIAFKRASEGLPEADPRSPTQDYDRWTEKDVPLYYY